MSAPEVEPTPTVEHIDAVAVEFEHVVVGSGYYAMNIGTSAANEAARAILTSSNPETHEALAANLPADVMLDALVRAGVLTEFRIDALLNEDGPLTTDAYIEHCNVVARQFVTPWEVAP